MKRWVIELIANHLRLNRLYTDLQPEEVRRTRSIAGEVLLRAQSDNRSDVNSMLAAEIFSHIHLLHITTFPNFKDKKSICLIWDYERMNV